MVISILPIKIKYGYWVELQGDTRVILGMMAQRNENSFFMYVKESK